MARTAHEIEADILQVRAWNRALYQAIEEIEPEPMYEDRTVEIVRRGYLKNPDKTASLHARILANDEKNNEFTRELIARYRSQVICE